ncbi:unnamed protein product [Boreogadus saida]
MYIQMSYTVNIIISSHTYMCKKDLIPSKTTTVKVHNWKNTVRYTSLQQTCAGHQETRQSKSLHTSTLNCNWTHHKHYTQGTAIFNNAKHNRDNNIIINNDNNYIINNNNHRQ